MNETLVYAHQVSQEEDLIGGLSARCRRWWLGWRGQSQSCRCSEFPV